MRLFHRHEGPCKSVNQIALWSDFGPRDVPAGHRTQVKSVCKGCGEPFAVTYKGLFTVSDFEGATIREKTLFG
jgi:hypothetical protein